MKNWMKMKWVNVSNIKSYIWNDIKKESLKSASITILKHTWRAIFGLIYYIIFSLD